MRAYFLFNLILLVILIVLDQLSKNFSVSFTHVYKNAGLFLGTFAEAPAHFRIITLATLSGFILFIYSVCLYFIPNNIKSLKVSLTFILGGILGNVYDRVALGYTRDFIPCKFLDIQFFYNVADIFLMLGTLGFIFIIFKYDKEIWIPDNSRKNYLINPKEQFQHGLKFLACSVITSIILGLFSLTFFKTYLHSSQRLINDYLLVFFVLSFLFSICTFIVGIFLAHRYSGPIYAFDQFIDQIIKGESSTFTLRDGDKYKNLENIAKKLNEHLDKN